MRTNSFFLFIVALLISASSSNAGILGMNIVSDPGVPDTVRIDSVRVALPPTGPIKVPVRFYNDEPLSAIEVTIKIIPSAGDPVVVDSVSFFGSRIGYLNVKGSSLHDSIITIFGLVVGENLISPGNGLLANVWFTATPPYGAYLVGLDTTTYSFSQAEHSTVFSVGGSEGIIPQIKKGYIAFELSCCIGDLGNLDGSVNQTPDLTDLQVMIDWLFRFPGNYYPVCPEEANLDGDPFNTIDITDLSILIDWLIGVTPSLPACP